MELEKKRLIVFFTIISVVLVFSILIFFNKQSVYDILLKEPSKFDKISKNSEENQSLGFQNGRFSPFEGYELEFHTTTQDGYDFYLNNSIYELWLKKHSSFGEVIRFQQNGTSLTFQPSAINYRNQFQSQQFIQEVRDNGYMLEGDTLIYNSSFGSGRDLEYTFTPISVEKRIVLANRSVLPEPQSFLGNNITFDLDFIIGTPNTKIIVNGQEWDRNSDVETSEQVLIEKADGTLIYLLRKPKATDASGIETNISYRFWKSGNNIFVSVKVPFAWLNDTSRIFPVFIDPDVDIQRGIELGLNTASTVEVTINPVNVSQCFSYITHSSGSSNPNRNFVAQKLTNSTTLELQVASAGSNIYVPWQVVCNDDFFAQRVGQTGLTGQTVFDFGLATPVNTSQTFVITSSRINSGDSTKYADGFFTARMLNSTTVRVVRNASEVSGGRVEVQVVQVAGANVQWGNVEFRSGGNRQLTTINPVNTSSSFIIQNFMSESGNGNEMIPQTTLINSTTVLNERASGTLYGNVSFFVVDYPFASVQRGWFYCHECGTGGVGQLNNFTIPNPVNQSATLLGMTYESLTSNAFFSRVFFSIELTNSTIGTVRLDTYGHGNISWEATTFLGQAPSGLACGDVLNTPGATYTMTQNLVGAADCFTVTANNITLDGNGYKISYINNTSDGFFAVNAKDTTNLTITNLTVINYTTSITTTETSKTLGAGLINVKNSNITGINSNGRSSANAATNAGKIIIINSNTTIIQAIGGTSIEALSFVNGGNGGNITIINSTVKTINVTGGNGVSTLSAANGGNAGIIKLENQVNISRTILDLKKGLQAGGGSDGIFGQLTINYTSFEDLNTIYSTNISTLIINNDSVAGSEIKFLREVGSGFSNISSNTILRFNFAEINSNIISQLNVSANVTLFGNPSSGLTSPIIGRDHVDCENLCFNFTSLTGATVIFNVTGWTNYSLIEGAVDPCVYTSGNWNPPCNCNITQNINLGGNNITLSGSGIFYILANITNVDKFEYLSSCHVPKLKSEVNII